MTIHTPDWVKDAVFYQIFPDRFAKSDRVQKPTNIEPWPEPPTGQGYKGGDLLGIVEKLDYIRALGINALYLNPIFQSACNHRYHTHDYYRVDPLLGGNDALRQLVEASHRRGIRVVLDGVFNHASRGFFQFNDILENGPYSAWLDWFRVEDWPLAPYDGSKPANYDSWVGNRALPNFNTDNPQVREYIMQIAEFWLREYEIDGWRLDVPAEITTPGFWEEFRQRVRAVNPEAYIVGEIWEVAPDWLQGDRFDALMNYPLTSAIVAFTAGERVSRPLAGNRSYQPYPALDAAGYAARIQQLLEAYDWEITQAQLNLLDSHDTPRILSLVRGDKRSVILATLLQMSFPGAPCVYYGNEIAIRGTTEYEADHDDKDARWPVPWQDESEWDKGMLATFKELIALRHNHIALRRGSYHHLYAAGDVYVFARRHEAETLLVAVNVAEKDQSVLVETADFLPNPHSLTPLYGQGAVTTGDDPNQIALSLPGRSGMVLQAETR
jgi:cyclomaltodextrinase / maltogenic alpha-amylase / neopullulanase